MRTQNDWKTFYVKTKQKIKKKRQLADININRKLFYNYQKSYYRKLKLLFLMKKYGTILNKYSYSLIKFLFVFYTQTIDKNKKS